MRHAPFVIGLPERDAWLRHMLGALSGLEQEQRISAEDSGCLPRLPRDGGNLAGQFALRAGSPGQPDLVDKPFSR